MMIGQNTVPSATAEKQGDRVPEAWNATAAPYPIDSLLHRLIEQQAERTPDAIAVAFAGATLTYREFNGRANRLAHALRKRGVGPETLVAVSAERSLELVVGLVAVLKAGGAYVPIDPSYPRDRQAFMFEDAKPLVLLTQTSLLEGLPKHAAQVFRLDADFAGIAGESGENPDAGTAAGNAAYVIYTSGSTGRPKGTINTHRNICNCLRWMQDTFKLTAVDRVLQKTTISFDVSVSEFFWPLIAGARVQVAPNELQFDHAALIAHIVEQRVTVINFAPSLLRQFLDEPGVAGCAGLRMVNAAGEALPYALQERFFARLPGCVLNNLYGPTEAAIYATAWTCRRDDPLRTVPIGRPLANTQIHVLGADGTAVPIGVEGELHIGGVQVCRGYLNRPELTAERFVRDPGSADPAARLYRTGDLARWRSDGVLEYLGRIDHQLKIRGQRIELGEVEATVASCPEVREVVVVAREHADAGGDKYLVAYFTAVAGADPLRIQSQVRQLVAAALPYFMVPAAFVLIERMPLNPNGKIDRSRLPDEELYAPAAARLPIAAAHPVSEPYLPLHHQLIEIWRQLLGRKDIAINDNFFAIGGNSLLAARMIARIQQAFGRKLPMTVLFAGPTVEHLAQAVMRHIGEDVRPVVELTPGNGQPPLFYLHGDLLGGGYYTVALARQLGPSVPFCVMSPITVSAATETPSIEAMAQEHIRHLRGFAPHGPYRLSGFCNSGVVMFEVARQLRQAGEEIEFLAMIDAEVPSPSLLRLRRIVSRLNLLLRRDHDGQLRLLEKFNHIAERWREIRALPLRRQLPALWNKLGRMWRRSSTPPGGSAGMFSGERDPLHAFQWALAGYRPGHYPGLVTLFVADFPERGRIDPALGWRTYADQVEVHVVPGQHLEVITHGVNHLAVVLGECLRHLRPGPRA